MANAWDKQENETNRSYPAFCEYLKLPPNERSLAKVAKILGKSETHIENWSRKYQWVSRAAAYDEYMAATAITVRAANLADAQIEHIQRMSLLSIMTIELGTRMLNDLKAAYEKGEPIDTRAFQRVVRTLIEMDTAARRNLQLPTTYRTERVDENEPEGEVYFIGGE